MNTFDCNTVTSLTMLYNGLLASGSQDSTIKIWDLTKPDSPLLHTLREHEGPVYALTQINNQFLASCSNDQTIKLWSISSYANVQTRLHVSCVKLAFEPSLNVIGGLDPISYIVKIWDSSFWTGKFYVLTT